jgi:ribosomal protein S18 acetylase RimI-like enzyme
VAELEGEPVGTVTNCVFEAIGWIAMLLVEERVRGRGIGRRLVEHALAYLDARGVRCARLDATPRGRPIYEKLGFVAEYQLARWEGPASGGSSEERVRPVTPEELDAVLELDREITGTQRRRLIERLYEERPEAIHVVGSDDGIAGYLTFRDGSNAAQIGPGVALSEAAGRGLGDVVLQRCAGQAVFVDVPIDNGPAMQWAESKGLVVQRNFTRMRRGEPVGDRPSQLWASSGPEKG